MLFVIKDYIYDGLTLNNGLTTVLCFLYAFENVNISNGKIIVSEYFEKQFVITRSFKGIEIRDYMNMNQEMDKNLSVVYSIVLFACGTV